jgi:hypothetical protein
LTNEGTIPIFLAPNECPNSLASKASLFPIKGDQFISGYLGNVGKGGN